VDDRSAPATKGDIAGLDQKFAQLRGDMNQGFEQLRGEMNRSYGDLAKRISDGETRLLKAFYNFAQSNQSRMTVIEAGQTATLSRLATIEDRLLQVEKRLNLPPAA